MAGTRPRVLQVGVIEHAHDTWAQITAVADVVVPQATDRTGFLAECRAGAFDGVVVVYRTFDSVRLSGPFDAELLAALPRSLRFVCHNGAGYDQIDVAACTARGIRVSNTPSVVDEAVADLHLFLLLGALRRLPPVLRSIRAGAWRGDGVCNGSGASASAEGPAWSGLLGHNPQGKVLGVLGLGGIGRAVARKAHAALGMRVWYHNRRRLPAAEEAAAVLGFPVTYAPTLDALLAAADVLSINVPLNAATRHLIGAPELARMKPGSVLVNTARGAIVDEAALVAALDAGHLAGAGLDVFEHEPAVHPGLLASDRVVLLPHMGTATVETEAAMEEWTMANVAQALRAGTLKSIVPEQAGLPL